MLPQRKGFLSWQVHWKCQLLQHYKMFLINLHTNAAVIHTEGKKGCLLHLATSVLISKTDFTEFTPDFFEKKYLMPGIWLHITVLTQKSYHRIKSKNCLELQAGYKCNSEKKKNPLNYGACNLFLILQTSMSSGYHLCEI